jgi:hypothetical protein
MSSKSDQQIARDLLKTKEAQGRDAMIAQLAAMIEAQKGGQK